MIKTINDIFDQRTEDIESIFSSYKTLFQIYTTGLKTANANPNTITALERSKKTVNEEQRKISNQLYSQGFILLTGASEALLKDIFECLLKENFTNIASTAGINFTTRELQEILKSTYNSINQTETISSELGKLTIKKIFSSKNPIEKINFQNTETTKKVFLEYFNIQLTESEYMKYIHKYWQIRHCLVHNNAIIDERFINNVRAVDLLDTTKEVAGYMLSLNKDDFDQAKKHFNQLFTEINSLIIDTKLKCSLIEIAN